MSAVQITGCSGAGKTTIAAELARRCMPAAGRPTNWTWPAQLRASGAIPIDAQQPLGRVIDAILSRTLATSGR